MRRSAALAVFVVVLCAASGAQPPVTVFSGDASKLPLTGAVCPTFSWTGVSATCEYELVVHKVGEVESESTGYCQVSH